MTQPDVVKGVPMDRGSCPFDPPGIYRELRESDEWRQVEVLGGRKAWMITDHATARDVLADNRFSADRSRPGFPFLQFAQKSFIRAAPVMVTTDEPLHSEIRRRASGAFTRKKVEQLKGFVSDLVDGLIDDMLEKGPPADLHTDFALQIPSFVIAKILGIPAEDHPHFHELTGNIFTLTNTDEQVEAARAALQDYLEEQITTKFDHPDDALLTTFAQAVQAGEMRMADATAQTRTLLIAGHETTASMIGLGTLYMIHHPEVKERVVTGSEREILGIVEELLRILTIMQRGLVRIAIEDVEVNGHLIKAGEGVHIALNAANRDPEVFENPDEVNLEKGTRRHVAFGYGIHQCLGQELARMEMSIAYPRLFQRIPSLTCPLDLGEVSFKNDVTVYGVKDLPVTWE
ncbi:MAG: cytochrome P450 [Bowdeniella nasicola]|nr:cytochrome P450 [Bowdeniella nasicola]